MISVLNQGSTKINEVKNVNSFDIKAGKLERLINWRLALL
jgi:hypothetical protein